MTLLLELNPLLFSLIVLLLQEDRMDLPSLEWIGGRLRFIRILGLRSRLTLGMGIAMVVVVMLLVLIVRARVVGINDFFLRLIRSFDKAIMVGSVTFDRWW